MQNTLQRLINKGYPYLKEILQSHFRVKTQPIQVGCQGFVDISSFEGIKGIVCEIQIVLWRKFLRDGHVGIRLGYPKGILI